MNFKIRQLIRKNNVKRIDDDKYVITDDNGNEIIKSERRFKGMKSAFKTYNYNLFINGERVTYSDGRKYMNGEQRAMFRFMRYRYILKNVRFQDVKNKARSVINNAKEKINNTKAKQELIAKRRQNIENRVIEALQKIR